MQINSPLYSNFILDLYIVYEINNWPINCSNNLTLKNCLFGTVKLLRNAIISKFPYNAQGIVLLMLDGAAKWNFTNDCARNVVIFGVDNTSIISYW